MAIKTTLTEINAKLIADKLAHDATVYLDLDATAGRYRVDPRQWLTWCRAGLVPGPAKVGGEHLRWSVAELIRWDWTQATSPATWLLYEASITPVDPRSL